ncbi:hypothetical protein EVAR_83225_1 [Eumeta japonica]|uniref:Uncharacterized protein n=1 Tax=Eumeta variegata TaxID=151549 RepID=A0A4C1Y5R8_EUMVA|nr:hypothetical protein EVAR_83225_1 [Eumeta japonica]
MRQPLFGGLLGLRSEESRRRLSPRFLSALVFRFGSRYLASLAPTHSGLLNSCSKRSAPAHVGRAQYGTLITAQSVSTCAQSVCRAIGGTGHGVRDAAAAARADRRRGLYVDTACYLAATVKRHLHQGRSEVTPLTSRALITIRAVTLPRTPNLKVAAICTGR